MSKILPLLCVMLLSSLASCVTNTSRGNLTTTYVGDFYIPENNSSATPDSASDSSEALSQQEEGINELRATIAATQQEYHASQQRALQTEIHSIPPDKSNQW